MTNTSKIIVAIVLVAILAIGVGYAAINNITLNITGTAAAIASQSSFSVVLTGTPEVSDTDIVTSAEVVNNGAGAEFTIANMSAKGDTATITYTVKNNSLDLSAELSATTSNSNTEYFTVSYAFKDNKTTLKAGETTDVTVTVELIKTPIEKDVTANVAVAVVAAPIQPQ